MQKEIGPAVFIPFGFLKYQGKAFSEYSPEERVKITDEIARALPTPSIFPPDRKRPNESIKEFYDRVVKDNGEGIVLQDLSSGELFKKKHRLDFDLKIEDIIEGSGRLKGSMGALVLSDRSGAIVGKVGTGFSDSLRDEIFKNKKSYLGKLVKISSDKPLLPKSIRGPSFIGFTVDKSVPDLL
jgi:ATP-dependent DNA ligase